VIPGSGVFTAEDADARSKAQSSMVTLRIVVAEDAFTRVGGVNQKRGGCGRLIV